MPMWLCACLFVVLPCFQEVESLSDEPKGDHAELRDQVGTTLNGLLSPCAYNLGYSNLAFTLDSPVGSVLLANTSAELESPAAVQAKGLLAILDRKQADESNTDDGTLLRTPTQSFRVSVGRDRAVQWCTSDPAYYSVLRTTELEFLYFSEGRRLEIRKPTRGLRMFRPADLISPLPASIAQIDQFVTATWKVQDLSGGCSRILASRPGSSRPWLRLDVGPPPARLPYSCTWFDDQDSSQGKFQTMIQWARADGVVVPTQLLRATHSAERIDIARYEVRDIDYLIQDADVRLPISLPNRIDDLTGISPGSIEKLEDLPVEWRSLLLVRERDSAPSEESR